MRVVKPKRGKGKRVALDPRAQGERYGRSWMTLSNRWANDPDIKYPKPDFYVGKTPYVYVSTLEAWEASLPKQSPWSGIKRADTSEAA